MRYWFSSDYHLGHANIIKYCNRPFGSLEEMNETIIKNHNERVKPEDTIFLIGDFCFRNSAGGKVGEGIQVKAKEWEARLNGNIIHIKGNHDYSNSTKTIIEKLVIRYGGKKICLIHNPKYADINYEINFTGHIHTDWEIFKLVKANKETCCINVGVDVNKFRPVSFEELMKKYRRWVKVNKEIK
jgi:calcineurin-like phosphoesterase family protein